MRKGYNVPIWSTFIIILIALDQLTKFLIVKSLEVGESIKVISNFLYITSHRNQGAAWGILQGKMWLFYIVTIVVLVILFMFFKNEGYGRPDVQLGLSLLIAGSIGNFIDRLFRGEVVDFVDTYIFSYNFPIFNVADAALTIGVIVLIIVILFEGKEEKA
ncbi:MULTISPECIES: signal peptidase II [Mammaliicoccus]|jgi:signal peptidase II|uniref:Lipoprotein signal peptidase n=5 Tax=Mammaliicoccus sciuri TaxID=1296 RepID=A0A2T4RVZ0_MAMSC|nr:MULTISPECIES: signal peptidase II [Mammaliicoccus]EZX26444.1 signal peptidase II [Staphylococcus aureus C0673]MBN4910867.1 signal peptidase II [Staphylococcus sp. EG-SA-13]ARB40996.1 signal peptidase II [Mammaliicoccus sciuri]KTT79792.1 signal peptidase II [Mammaliicoccus sciuri]MBA1396196.1 lipoprotein signal peptidase [Mammaliicoccus sciuri]